MTAFALNGKPVTAKSEASTPLLWVIRDELKLTGTKYGCGIAAVANAFYKLTGKRLRHMPFTPARVQQVLKA